MERKPKKMPDRLLCFWRKPDDHLSINVIQQMESEAERATRAIEVSHGSAGEFSKSAASQTYISNKHSVICRLLFCLFFALVLGAFLPLFWFGSVPNISAFMKKATVYRLPVTIVVEVLLLTSVIVCLIKLKRITKSMQRRASYFSSCSGGDFSSSYNANIVQTARSDSLRESGSLRHKTTSRTSSNMHIVALRQILEDLPEESVQRIQELAIKFLNSGNGRSSIEPGKFNISHRISIESDSGKAYKIATKVLLVGDINVGKTSIFHRILYDQFSSSYLQTIGADLGFSTLLLSANDELDELSVGLQIWDIGGQEQLARATKVYYKDAVIVIPVADVTNFASLKSLRFWLNDILSKVHDPYMVLLLNKADLGTRAITEDDINAIAELQNIERYEVSAKTGANVYKAFTESIAKVIIKETSKFL